MRLELKCICHVHQVVKSFRIVCIRHVYLMESVEICLDKPENIKFGRSFAPPFALLEFYFQNFGALYQHHRVWFLDFLFKNGPALHIHIHLHIECHGVKIFHSYSCDYLWSCWPWNSVSLLIFNSWPDISALIVFFSHILIDPLGNFHILIGLIVVNSV